MSDLKTRLAMFFIAVPIMFATVLLLPMYLHLAFQLFIVVFILLGSMEMRKLFALRGIPVPAYLPWLSLGFPIAAYAETLGLTGPGPFMFFLVLMLLVILGREAFISREEDLAGSLSRMAASMATFLYPGFLGSFASRLPGLPHASLRLFLFFWLVFSTDTFAYIFGMAFGRRSRKISLVSPNKSLVGFIGGFLSTVAFAIGGHFLFPYAFGSLPTAIATGVLIAAVSIFGDLAESALKRSAAIKDSGDAIPGRGGILDTIDSLVFAAPVYFYLLSVWGAA